MEKNFKLLILNFNWRYDKMNRFINKTKKIILHPFYKINFYLNNNPKYIVLGHQKSGTSLIASLLAEKRDK